jgi:hypothetical protein
MLFEGQRSDLTGSKHEFYFAGAAIMDSENRIAFLTGVRTKEEPKKIIANVEYIHENGASVQAFNKVLTPGNFEKFLNEFAMKTATITKGQGKLVELSHRFKPIDDNKYLFLEDMDKNAILHRYLIQLIIGGSQKEAIQSVGQLIKVYKSKQEA